MEFRLSDYLTKIIAQNDAIAKHNSYIQREFVA